jgi:hypothetical protein
MRGRRALRSTKSCVYARIEGALGVPARTVRPLTDGERRQIGEIRDRYLELKERYRTALGGGLERRGGAPRPGG